MVNRTHCLYCTEPITERHNNTARTYCSISCAALHRVSIQGMVKPKRVRKIEYSSCIGCGKDIQLRGATPRKYCSNKCQQLHIWKTVERPKVEIGEGSAVTCKRYLIETRGEFCFECGIGAEWNKNPLTLQLDHIDGNSDNGSVKNIRLLCPNCHTQTPTHGSKGGTKKKNTKRNTYLRKFKGGVE